MPDRPKEGTKQWFLMYADECYVVTRFCFFAFLQSTVFRMAHHSLEYYLKAYLAPHLSLSELKAFSHRLSDLGRKFEDLGGSVGPLRPVLDYMDLFERLRYPHIGSFTHVLWGCPYEEFFGRFETEKVRKRVACFHLGDFDELVSTIRGAVVTAEKWPPSPGPAPEGTKYLFRENAFFRPRRRET